MILSFIFYVSLLSYTVAQEPPPFQWLLGTWKLENKNIYEVWGFTKNGKSLIGKSFIVEGVDTIITEEISLIKNGNTFFYIPDVAGDQESIEFEITSYTPYSFVAENSRHDFPKTIRYTRNGSTTSGERIEAVIEGNGKKIVYQFNRED